MKSWQGNNLNKSEQTCKIYDMKTNITFLTIFNCNYHPLSVRLNITLHENFAAYGAIYNLYASS